MGKLCRMTLLVLAGSIALPLTANCVAAATYERCVKGYRNTQSASYRERLQKQVSDCVGWDEKLRRDPRFQSLDDDAQELEFESNPCYGPSVCAEELGINDTRAECGEVSAEKHGTPAQVREAKRIYDELMSPSIISICTAAQ